jgi:hypothetical protein
MGKIESRIEVLRKLGNRGDGLVGLGASFSMGRDSGPSSFKRRPRQCGLAGRRDTHLRAERPLLGVLAALYITDAMGVSIEDDHDSVHHPQLSAILGNKAPACRRSLVPAPGATGRAQGAIPLSPCNARQRSLARKQAAPQQLGKPRCEVVERRVIKLPDSLSDATLSRRYAGETWVGPTSRSWSLHIGSKRAISKRGGYCGSVGGDTPLWARQLSRSNTLLLGGEPLSAASHWRRWDESRGCPFIADERRRQEELTATNPVPWFED